ncbi:biotin transporter BioY [Pyrococcus yayanosii]|uniref:biotin transporter BioY n=1 Tax=Pyrococcus yayanosii TaxID=1008460 RepID=UPI001ED8FBAC|nr:biotin transporter BioY [Pyrococcus yayanosii]
MGLPVFANFSGGISHVLGPTGGYILAFPVAALIAGIFYEKSLPWRFLGTIIGLAVIYLLGWLRLGLFFGDFGKAFAVGVVPFILLDIVKAAVAVAIAQAIRRRAGHSL